MSTAYFLLLASVVALQLAGCDGSKLRLGRSTGCAKDGRQYKEGEEFARSHLLYKCGNGKAGIVGCRIDENRKLAVGEDVLDRMFGPIGMVYRCYNWEGTVAYQEYACGFRNTPSCTIPAKPYTAADIEVFAQKSKPFVS